MGSDSRESQCCSPQVHQLFQAFNAGVLHSKGLALCEILRGGVNVLLMLLTVLTAGAALFPRKMVEAMILVMDPPFSPQK